MKRSCFTIAVAGVACTALVSSALALDLNSFRAQHGRAPLAASSALAGAAHAHAQRLAGRQRLDHAGFRQRVGAIASTAAENVAVLGCARPDAKPGSTFAGRACGCDTEDCAIRMWARSGRHRANMLMGGVSHYGIASATAANGRRYWVLIVGN